MRGYRAKLGILVPSSNTTMEPELHDMIPKGYGISIHSSRIKITEDSEEQIANMVNYVESAADLLKDANVDIIAFGCTSGSFIKGVNYDKTIIKLIEDVAKVPATTTSTSVIKALKELKLSRISVASPYESWLNQKLKEFLEAQGFTVLKIKGLGVVRDIGHVPPERVYRLAKEVNDPGSNGLFISCTDFRTIEVLNSLEHDLRKPVISSNQATLWDMLKMLDIKIDIQGYGKLLTTLNKL
jgi:maleate isomerase